MIQAMGDADTTASASDFPATGCEDGGMNIDVQTAGCMQVTEVVCRYGRKVRDRSGAF